MKSKNYQIFSKIFLLISIILFIAFLFSSTFILINQKPLHIQLDSVGFTNFLNIFSPSLQIGATSIIVFTLWLTLERMKQTQVNITFNNYYKHKEEFIAFLKKMPFFDVIQNQSQFEVDVLLPPVYSYFFNKSYNDFEPSLNIKSKKEINNFIDKIKESSISLHNQNLENVSIDDLKKLSELINQTIEPICAIYTEIEAITVRQHFMTVGGRPIKSVEERFRLLSNLFWTTSVYDDILSFDGIHQSARGNFTLNFTNYRTSIGL